MVMRLNTDSLTAQDLSRVVDRYLSLPNLKKAGGVKSRLARIFLVGHLADVSVDFAVNILFRIKSNVFFCFFTRAS